MNILSIKQLLELEATGVRILVLTDGEFSSDEVVKRMIEDVAEVPMADLEAGDINAEDFPKLIEATKKISTLEIWMDDRDPSERTAPTDIKGMYATCIAKRAGDTFEFHAA